MYHNLRGSGVNGDCAGQWETANFDSMYRIDIPLYINSQRKKSIPQFAAAV